jgi:hypothetical protein
MGPGCAASTTIAGRSNCRRAPGTADPASQPLFDWKAVRKTGSDGAFSFLVHEGLSYITRASFWDEAQRKQVSGTVGPFVIRGDMRSVMVVLSSAR